MADVVARAARLRDVIRRLVLNELERNRPKYKYAEVVEIDLPARTCRVLYPGDGAAITVRIGSIVPSAVGQIVRVDGLPGDRFIADVMGVVGLATEEDITPPGAPTNVRAIGYLDSIAVTWADNLEPDVRNGAGTYNVQVATDIGMTQIVRDTTIGGTYFLANGLRQQETYYARVRAIDSSGNIGTWSAVTSATTGTDAEEAEIEFPSEAVSPSAPLWGWSGPLIVTTGPILPALADGNLGTWWANLTVAPTQPVTVSWRKNGVIVASVTLNAGETFKTVAANVPVTKFTDKLQPIITAPGQAASDLTTGGVYD